MTLFSGLEQRWLHAFQQRDTATLESLLDDGYELRLASRPDRPIPRAEYLRQAGEGTVSDGTVSQMAARDLGGLVLVSFQLETKGSEGVSQRAFVIDVWQPMPGPAPEHRSPMLAATSWKVAARYLAGGP